MKKVVLILIIMFSLFKNASANYTKLAYDFQFKGINGETINLSEFKL